MKKILNCHDFPQLWEKKWYSQNISRREKSLIINFLPQILRKVWTSLNPLRFIFFNFHCYCIILFFFLISISALFLKVRAFLFSYQTMQFPYIAYVKVRRVSCFIKNAYALVSLFLVWIFFLSGWIIFQKYELQ